MPRKDDESASDSRDRVGFVRIGNKSGTAAGDLFVVDKVAVEGTC